jgi:hypothetical protein
MALTMIKFFCGWPRAGGASLRLGTAGLVLTREPGSDSSPLRSLNLLRYCACLRARICSGSRALRSASAAALATCSATSQSCRFSPILPARAQPRGAPGAGPTCRTLLPSLLVPRSLLERGGATRALLDRGQASRPLRRAREGRQTAACTAVAPVPPSRAGPSTCGRSAAYSCGGAARRRNGQVGPNLVSTRTERDVLNSGACSTVLAHAATRCRGRCSPACFFVSRAMLLQRRVAVFCLAACPRDG